MNLSPDLPLQAQELADVMRNAAVVYLTAKKIETPEEGALFYAAFAILFRHYLGTLDVTGHTRRSLIDAWAETTKKHLEDEAIPVPPKDALN
jgi:hypothetical protein